MFTASPCSSSLSRRRFFAAFTGLLALLLLPAFAGVSAVHAQTPPTFSKVFSPGTIGPGSTSTLQFDIANASPTTGVRDLAFTDNLPAGVTIASPANASTDCSGGTLSAPDGGSTISYSDGSMLANSTCSITVDVTSSTPGVHNNVSGDLTSDQGNSGPATADLTVATDRPGFTKSFSPASIFFGGRSTLTFTINNSANSSVVPNLDFTDNLPTGMVIASPANASTTCGTATVPPTLTAVAGTSVIILDANGTGAFPAVAAGATCTVTVDVTGNATGSLGNVTDNLLADFVPVGKASAVLTVSTPSLAFIKEFTDDPATPGGTVNLAFTISNLSRSDNAANISFTDDLDAVISGLEATGLPASACGGTLGGTSVLSFSGGALSPETSCTINVTLQVPGGVSGSFSNTTSAITADVGGTAVTGDPAMDDLFVVAAPILTKEFIDDPVTPGDDVTLRFTIENASDTEALTDLAFIDELTTFLPFPVVATLPADGFCGGSSSMSIISLGTEQQELSVTDGSLAGGGTCTFDVTLSVPLDVASNTYLNVTSTITGLLDGVGVVGNPATDNLVVVAAPDLSKEFIDDPVTPGGTAALKFTISNRDEAPSDATNIAFTDDLSMLNPALPDLLATGLPASACGGTVSTPDGGVTIAFSGGSLMPGEDCAFSVTLDVPTLATAGTYFNKTSNITATVAGLPVAGDPGADNLLIAPLTLEKEFTDDPVLPGETVTLAFTFTNSGDGMEDAATDIIFTDDLDDVLDGLTATGLPLNDICGTGSSLTGSAGDTFLTFQNGMLGANDTCTFSVTLNVPANAEPDAYTNTTSAVSATIGGVQNVALNPASDELIVEDATASIVITKEFTDDPVAPGGAVNLEFNIGYAGPSDATGITFDDDLNAVLTGLASTGLPANDVCGTGSQLSESAGVLTLTGGTLTPGGSCTFSVSLTVPLGTLNGAYTNTTSTITADVGAGTVTGEPATDDVTVIGVPSNGPIANAGPDQTVECAAPEGASVTLDGSASIDPSEGTLTFTWTEGIDEEGNPIVIATGANPTLTLSLGVHTITLTVFDEEGIPDTDEVVITINDDTTAPVITLLGDNPLTLECAIDEYEDPGFTVVEACDANVEVIVGGDVVDPGTPGTYVVTYDATDAEGNVATQVTRTVTVEDTTAPVLTLIGDDPLTLQCPAPYDEPGADIDEACDATATVIIGGDTVDPTTLGTYLVTYDATDASGNAATQLTRTVDVVDTVPPTITLAGDNPLTIIRFSGPYVEPGASAVDDCDGPVPVQITGTVDTNTPGSYFITYDAVDAAGNPAQEIRTVNVIDDPGTLAHGFLFLSDKKIDLGDRAQTEGDIHSNDEIHLKHGPATYVGDLTAVEKIKIDDDVTIDGDVTSGDEIDIGHDVTITGTVTEFASVPPVSLPSLSFSTGGADIKVEENETLALAPGSYGKVEVEDDATLQLSSGDYFIEELKLKKNVNLEIDVATGPVDINVEKNIDIDDNLTTMLSPLGDVDSRYVTFASLKDVTVDKGSVLVGQVIAPFGKVELKEDMTFRGSVCAEEIKGDKDGVFAFHDSGVMAPITLYVAASGVSEGKQTEPDAREVEDKATDEDDVATLAEATDEAEEATDDAEVAADIEAAAPVEIAEAAAEVPAAYMLHSNYPNPFNPVTQIRFGLPEAAAVRLIVYDMLGRQVRVLVDGLREAGTHEVAFDGATLPSGAYLYRLETPQGSFVKTMLLMK